MKITEITKGKQKVHVAIYNEEIELLEKLRDTDSVYKNELSERQQLIANQLVNKDLLIRINDNNRIVYKKPTG
jgi:hypothetical protein